MILIMAYFELFSKVLFWKIILKVLLVILKIPISHRVQGDVNQESKSFMDKT